MSERVFFHRADGWVEELPKEGGVGVEGALLLAVAVLLVVGFWGAIAWRVFG